MARRLALDLHSPAATDAAYGRAIPQGTARTMTVGGVINKALIIAVLVAVTFVVGWSHLDGTVDDSALVLVLGASLLGTVLSLIISFKPVSAPWMTPLFALIEGYVLGALSALFETEYPGIASQAGLATLGVFTGVLTLYKTRVLRVTERVRSIVQIAMWSVFFVYAASFAMTLLGFTFPYIHDSGPIGIAFSLLVIVVASFMLLTDFDFIERGAARGAPSYMEWYGAFAMLVSLVWVYVEFLRLLAKIRSR